MIVIDSLGVGEMRSRKLTAELMAMFDSESKSVSTHTM